MRSEQDGSSEEYLVGDHLSLSSFIFFLMYIIFYLCIFVLGLHCCTGFFHVAPSGGYSLVEVHRLLIVVASLVRERGLWSCGTWLSSCGSQALEHRLKSCDARA